MASLHILPSVLVGLHIIIETIANLAVGADFLYCLPVICPPDTITPAQRSKEGSSKKQLSTDEKGKTVSQPSRHRYGMYENVLLSDEELQKLQAEFPADYQSRIERLSEYMASSGRRYKNHLATIRSWARRDSKQSKLPAYSHDNYRYKEGESL